MLNYVHSDYINQICVIYMNDILVFSTLLTEHFESLQKVFDKLNEYNLNEQIDKGHINTNKGIKLNPEKFSIIKNQEP